MEKITSNSFPFSVTIQDYEASSKDFFDCYNCPASIAFKRQFPQYERVLSDEYYISIQGSGGEHAKMLRPFTQVDFDQLANTGTEFHTTLTFLTNDQRRNS